MVKMTETSGLRSSLGKGAILSVVSVLVTFLVVEAFLRLAPETIGVPLLVHFPPTLRQEIAARIGLPTMNAHGKLSSAERVDGGPPIPYPLPNSVVRRAQDDADLELGAVEAATMDSRGFCNPPEAAGRATVDVVAIGDSFTYCLAVKPEDAAAAIFARESGMTSYNLGIPSIGPREYIELLRKFGLPLKPKFVVMNIYEGNDLRDGDRFMQFKKSGKGRGEDKQRMQRLIAHSYAASLVYAAYDWLDDSAFLKGKPKIDFGYSAMSQGSRVAMNVNQADKDEARYARFLIEGKVSLDLFLKPLDDLKQLAAENGFTPIVTYIPSFYTAYAKTVTFDDPKVGEAATEFSRRQRAFIAEAARARGLPFRDVTPAMQAAAETGPLTHFPANVHLTPFGHRVVAGEWRKAIDQAQKGS